MVLFLEGEWHYSAVRAGLGIAPGPATAAVFAVNAGRISARFGRVRPALIGALRMVIAAGYWMIATGATPDYAGDFLPGLLFGGISAGLVQAPLFAAAGTLPPERATTGSAVLMVTAFHHVWAAEAIAGLLACVAVATTATTRGRWSSPAGG